MWLAVQPCTELQSYRVFKESFTEETQPCVNAATYPRIVSFPIFCFLFHYYYYVRSPRLTPRTCDACDSGDVYSKYILSERLWILDLKQSAIVLLLLLHLLPVLHTPYEAYSLHSFLPLPGILLGFLLIATTSCWWSWPLWVFSVSPGLFGTSRFLFPCLFLSKLNVLHLKIWRIFPQCIRCV